MSPKKAKEKIKVSDLAEQLKIEPAELLSILKDLGVSAKTKASAIDDDTAKLVKDLIKEQKGKKTEKKPKKTPEDKPKVELIKKVKTVKKVKEEDKLKLPFETKPEEKPKIEEIIPAKEAAPVKKEIIVKEKEIVVKDLADLLKVKTSDLIKELMKKGIMSTINQKIPIQTAIEVGAVFGEIIKSEEKKEKVSELEKISKIEAKEAPDLLVPRPPVVVVMGHVDHGKTKLLDAIRKTKVAEKEAGGITQHIGAYQVEVKGRKVTFLDTPGHEAFTALRARGAKVTDIAILVVAADDGIMPQTIEALNHAKAAKVPIIVAINKIDKPEANLDKVKQQLVEHGLTPEDWGGDTVTVPISAKFFKGIDELLDMVLLVADMQELKANPNKPATGVVVESRLDKTRGTVATVLIRGGTLHVGDIFSCGATYGKVRAMLNEWGKRLSSAPPATPIEILGASEVPRPGDILRVVGSEKEAKELAAAQLDIQEKVFKGRLLSLENYSKHIKEGERKDLNIIIKTDVQGSMEGLTKALSDLFVSGIHVNILHSGVGDITESDIMLASASESIIVGFHVDFSGNSKEMAEDEGVDVRLYDIIYKVSDDIKFAMEGILEPVYEEVILGHAEVRQMFKYSKVGMIAGCFVKDGRIVRGCSVRVMRDNEKIFEGKLDSLKRFKDDVKAVETGFECGISFAGFDDFKPGDIIEAFEMRKQGKR